MKILVHTPYGSQHQESGLLYLLANFLKDRFPDISQLQCNGVQPLCERDSETHWKRVFSTCFTCMHDQDRLRQWAGIKLVPLARQLLPQEIERVRVWSGALPAERLESEFFDGVPVWNLCHGTFRNRFGVEKIDSSNRQHVQVARRLITSAARTLVATREYANTHHPEVALVADGRDFITQSVLNELRSAGTRCILFRWDVHQRCIVVEHADGSQRMNCDLVIEDVTSMRADIATWPSEIVAIMNGLAAFLDLGDSQLALRMAQ